MIYFFERERNNATSFNLPLDEASFKIIDLLVEMERNPTLELSKNSLNRGELFSSEIFSVYNKNSVVQKIHTDSQGLSVKVNIRKRFSSKGIKYDIIVTQGHRDLVSAFRDGISIQTAIVGIIDETNQNSTKKATFPIIPFSRVFRDLGRELWEESGAIGD